MCYNSEKSPQNENFDECPPPESIVYHSMEELKEMLAEGVKSLNNGKGTDGDEVLKRLKKKYSL